MSREDTKMESSLTSNISLLTIISIPSWKLIRLSRHLLPMEYWFNWPNKRLISLKINIRNVKLNSLHFSES